jgi:hypothetical protein
LIFANFFWINIFPAVAIMQFFSCIVNMLL